MSCLPGMPCYSEPSVTVTYPAGCVNRFLGYPISSDVIFYNGPNLPCTGVQYGALLTEALQVIDQIICPANMTESILAVLNTNETLRTQFCLLVGNCISPTTTTTTTTVIP